MTNQPRQMTPSTLKADPPDVDNDIIDEAYAITIDPVRYDKLLATWQTYIDSRMATVDGRPSPTQATDSMLEAHVRRALVIFDRIGRGRRDEKTAESLVENLPVFAAVIAVDGNIVAANQLAKTRMMSPVKPSLSGLLLDDETSTRLKAWMSSVPSEDQSLLVLPCRLGKDQEPSCIIGTRVSIGPSAGNASDGQVLLTTIDVRYDQGVADAMADAFKLTRREAEIALALAGGLTPASIADDRAVSLETVRTQIKSILKKLGVASAPELIRILNGFAVSYRVSKAMTDRAAASFGDRPCRRLSKIRLDDGRWLAFQTSGAENGRPVLFIHDMLHAPTLTDAAVEVAERKNWRLIAPSRPGFGQSDDLLGAEGTERLDAFASDMTRLLDHLDIEKILVVGHMSGGISALRLAVLFPHRVRALALVSCVPSWTDANLALLPKRVGLFVRTARHAPSVLPLLARAGAAYVDAGYVDQLIRLFHGDNPADMLALRRPEVRQIVIDGIRHGIHQGVAGFCHECPIILRDWTPQAQRLRQPVHLLLGKLDFSCRPEHAEHFVKALPRGDLTTIDSVGLHLLYTHWPKLFEVMTDLDRRSV